MKARTALLALGVVLACASPLTDRTASAMTDEPGDCAHPQQAATRDVRVRHSGSRSRGLVLFAHPGGFVFGTAAMSLPHACRFARAGFEVLSLNYPLASYTAAVAYARRAAHGASRHRAHVYIVGESAGGAIAAAVATTGYVDAAVSVAGPVDLAHWRTWDAHFWDALHLSPRQRARESALHVLSCARKHAPLLLYHSPHDGEVEFAQARRLADAIHAPLRRLTGPHLADESWVPGAIRWLRRH